MAPPRTLLALACAAAVAIGAAGADVRAGPGPARVAWLAPGPEIAARAKAEGRVVLLSVSASWCHWCHVMDERTYADPRVVALVRARFLPVRVDADARPDLAERFAEYHWPATAFVGPDGRTILALRGYRGPDDLLTDCARVLDAARDGRRLLDADAPGAGGGAPPARLAEESFLPALRDRLRAYVDGLWDEREAGWGRGQKYPHVAALEHALLRARVADDAVARGRSEAALAQQARLIDPVWGGMYQYSEGGVWTRPHFEKVMSVNAGALGNFARAARRTGDPRRRDAARAVRRYLVGFLRSPSGAFATSQDADLRVPGGRTYEGRFYFGLDDAGRRRLGIPHIDPAVYAQENGWAIRALCALHRATLDPAVLAEATAAAKAVLGSHRTPDGAFRHAAGDPGPLHLGDQVAMGHALLALHQSTGDATHLDEAVRTASAMLATFLDRERGGFFGTSAADPLFPDRLRPFEGNAAAARFLVALGHAVPDDGRFRREAVRALAAISEPGLAERFGPRAAEALLAVEEALAPSVRVEVVGRRGTADEAAMWTAALSLDEPTALLHRRPPDEPEVSGTVALVCGPKACEPPIVRPAKLAEVAASARR